MSNPYYPPAPAYSGQPASGQAMKRRNIFAAWLLPFVTLGIYQLVWYYRINRELRDFNPRQQVDPWISLLAVTFGGFLIIPPFVSTFRTGKRIRAAQSAAGVIPKCSPGVGLVLSFFFGLFALYYQNELNRIIDRYQGAPPGTQVPIYQ